MYWVTVLVLVTVALKELVMVTLTVAVLLSCQQVETATQTMGRSHGRTVTVNDGPGILSTTTTACDTVALVVSIYGMVVFADTTRVAGTTVEAVHVSVRIILAGPSSRTLLRSTSTDTYSEQ
jgi:hypothetical protein